jgi:hypothetical protein
MKHALTLLAILFLAPVAMSERTPEGSGDEEYFGFTEEYPVISSEFQVAEASESPSRRDVRAELLLNSPCVEVDYDLHHDGPLMHYIDYYLEENGSQCFDLPTYRDAIINLSELVEGDHVVSIMGPDGKETKIKFTVDRGEPLRGGENLFN